LKMVLAYVTNVLVKMNMSQNEVHALEKTTFGWCFQRKTGSNIWACCLIEG